MQFGGSILVCSDAGITTHSFLNKIPYESVNSESVLDVHKQETKGPSSRFEIVSSAIFDAVIYSFEMWKICSSQSALISSPV